MLWKLLANRWINMVALTLIALTITFSLQPYFGPQAAIFGTIPVVTWLLGQQHYRALVIEADLVDKEKLAMIERSAASLFSWSR